MLPGSPPLAIHCGFQLTVNTLPYTGQSFRLQLAYGLSLYLLITALRWCMVKVV